MEKLLKDSDNLYKILEKGSKKANLIAKNNLKEVAGKFSVLCSMVNKFILANFARAYDVIGSSFESSFIGDIFSPYSSQVPICKYLFNFFFL